MMNPEKTINFDFFTVECAPGIKFADLLDRAAGVPNDIHRNREMSGHPVRLDEYDRQGQIHTGDMVKIRMSNLPPKACLRGGKVSLGLASDEGLGEETAFLYHADLNVIVIQRNRLGIGHGKMSEYFQALLNRGPVEFFPIVTFDGLERLRETPDIRQFEIRVAGLDDASPLKGQGISCASIVDTMEELKAPVVTLVFGAGRGKRGLSKQDVCRMAGKLVKHSGRGKTIPVLRARVFDPEDGIIPLDLIQDRVCETMTIKPGSDRRISYEARSSAARAAWERKQKTIRGILGN